MPKGKAKKTASKSSLGSNPTTVEGSGNFVVSPHTVEGGMHVYGRPGLFRNKKVRISLSIGGTALLTVAALVAWNRYSSSSNVVPLTVAVETLTPTCGTGWIVPRPPDQIEGIAALQSPSNFQHGWRDWPGGAGGAAASGDGAGGHVQMSVQGRTPTQVVLTDMKVRVLERKPPISGTLVQRPCGDQWAYRWLDVDLDKEPPKPLPTLVPEGYLPDSPSFERKPISFPYRVAESDAEIFLVNAKTATCDCRWVVDVYWSSAGESGVLTVDDHGAPFRTSSDSNAVKCTALDRLHC
jgi:hypothetical protein